MKKTVKPEKKLKKLKIIPVSKDTITSHPIAGAIKAGPGYSSLESCPPTISEPVS